MSDNKIREMKKRANWVRRQVLEMGVRAGSGHTTSAFSCAELLVALYYGNILRFDVNNPRWDKRDRFILSKAQAGIALYPILAELGFFPVSELEKFAESDSCLGVHAENNIPGVEATTGSLGHGLGLASGIALSAKLDKKDWLTMTMMGDAECYEGSVWEAAMFAAHNKLNNLILIIDRNWMGVTDFTESSLKLDPLEKKWKSFGWDAVTIDGHSFDEILSAFKDARTRRSSKPYAIIAETVKGKGVSFMENKKLWHYRVPVGEEIDIARRELEKREND